MTKVIIASVTYGKRNMASVIMENVTEPYYNCHLT